MTNVRFYNVDFLRFIFSLIIVVYHLFNKGSFLLTINPDNELYVFLHNTIGYSGQTCVDLFFVIAGFFFMLTFKPSLTVIEFLKKKFIRFFHCYYGCFYYIYS